MERAIRTASFSMVGRTSPFVPLEKLAQGNDNDISNNQR
jgi:hypothetical protein